MGWILVLVGHVRSSEVMAVTPNLTARRKISRLTTSTSSKTPQRLEVTDQTMTLRLEKNRQIQRPTHWRRTLVDWPPESGNLNWNWWFSGAQWTSLRVKNSTGASTFLYVLLLGYQAGSHSEYCGEILCFWQEDSKVVILKEARMFCSS